MIDSYTLQVFVDRFVARFDCYNKQGFVMDRHGEMKFGYPLIREPVTPELIQAHIAGAITLAFPAIDAQNMCKCLVWDCDTNESWLDPIEAVLNGARYHTIRDGARPGKNWSS